MGGAPAKLIEKCTVPGTVAITFDDGPAETTHILLDALARYPDVKVTFFINGNNYVDASLPQYQAVINRAYQAGHQIASHTLQHKDLTKLDDAGIQDQMLKNDDVIYSATGRVPRYMRPPYGSIDDDALKSLGNMGYIPVNWDVDTLDWKYDDADRSAQAYTDALKSNPEGLFIALQHDTMNSTVKLLMDKVIPQIRQQNLKMVTVAACLGDSKAYL
jgi:peptidoglycan/xylan/chitin deacetylase (PgdA/CDA1 family)